MTRLQNIKIEESIQGSAGSDVHDFVLKASAFVLLVAGYSLEQYHLSYALSKIQLILCMCMLYRINNNLVMVQRYTHYILQVESFFVT